MIPAGRITAVYIPKSRYTPVGAHYTSFTQRARGYKAYYFRRGSGIKSGGEKEIDEYRPAFGIRIDPPRADGTHTHIHKSTRNRKERDKVKKREKTMQ